MYYPDDLVEEVRSSTDIVGYISSHINLKRQGSNYIGLCPFHNEKTPSFSVSPSRQMYYCFGCGAGGNVFTFAMEYDNLSFPEAVQMLAEKNGIALPQAEESAEAKRQNNIRNLILDINKEAGIFFYSVMKSKQGEIGYNYFKGRGLTDDTIKKFALGYSGKNGGLYSYLKSKGYKDEDLQRAGLFTFDERYGARDKFWNRVMFPIMDANNRVIAFGGRVMGDALPKYLNSPETAVFDKSRNLYGLNYAKHARKPYFILCEGYMDVIALHQAGFDNALASLGTAFTGLQANLIKRYVKKVVISYDSDGAGVKAALRAIPILKNAGLSVKVLNMQPYKDPDEFIKNLGADEYERRIENAQNSFMFEISVLEKEYDFSDAEQKTEFYNELAKKLLTFEDDLERGNYIEAVAAKYGIRMEDLKKLVMKMSARIAGIPEKISVKKNDKQRNLEDGLSQAQGLLLTWLTNEPVLINRIKNILSPEDYSEELFNKIAELIYSQYEASGQVVAAKIIDSFDNAQDQSLAAGILHRQLPEQGLDHTGRQKAFNELVRKIKKQSIDKSIRTATKPEDIQKLMTMMSELQRLNVSL